MTSRSFSQFTVVVALLVVEARAAIERPTHVQARGKPATTTSQRRPLLALLSANLARRPSRSPSSVASTCPALALHSTPPRSLCLASPRLAHPRNHLADGAATTLG